MIVLLLFAFLSGLVTIAAPCIWPLLPIILSSSILGSDHRRPLGITIGILISFARRVGRTSSGQNPDFIHGFITGLSLGVVWTPCAGPILAAIATLAATRAVNFEIIIVTVVYLIGVGIPLFIFAYAGQQFIAKSRFLNKYTGNIQKIFGVIMIATALLIATNYDKVLQAKLLDAFPAYSDFIIKLENNGQVKKQLDAIKGKDDMVGKPFNPMGDKKINELFNVSYPAPELTGITNWLNLPAGRQVLTLKELRGKVVLIDVWTYTCINCIRTLPHVTSWYDKYNKDGFVVIGLHTPEFEFEKNTFNVEGAIKQYNIHYPVAQDNDYAT